VIDHHALQLALRARALTLTVAECSGVNLSASGSGFVRASGSFLTDGFSLGMEVLADNFSDSDNDGYWIVTNVSATTLTVDGSLNAESAGANKTLTVGLPSSRAWENIEFEPTTGSPWVEEQLIPAGSRQISVGPEGTLETRLLYSLAVHAVENKGVGAPNRYADALLELFTPRTSITFGSLTARVRTDTGPYRGQMLRRKPGYMTVPVTFPLEVYSQNTI
jgi:hypothetical protein